jgi:hypothetical protein
MKFFGYMNNFIGNLKLLEALALYRIETLSLKSLIFDEINLVLE